MLWFRFEQRFEPFTMLFFEVSSETGFLDMYLTTVVRVRNVENTLAMRVIFSLQIFKIPSTFVKCQKKVVIFVQTV